MHTETVQWHLADGNAPDADLIVVACHDDQVFMAWFDGDGWHDCANGGNCSVTWWAEIKGPNEHAGHSANWPFPTRSLATGAEATQALAMSAIEARSQQERAARRQARAVFEQALARAPEALL